MKPLHLCAAAVLLLLVAVSPALADVAPPDHKKAPKPGDIRTDLPFMHMTILPVEGLREARLQVPRDLLSKLPAAPAGVAGSVDGARPFAFGTVSTVVAGLFLSLSCVLAGLVLVRSRRRVAGRAVAAVLVCVVASAAAAVAAYANAAPPVVGRRAQDPGTLLKLVPDGMVRGGQIRIEVVEEGYGITLLVPTKEWKGDEEE
jgi:hypothetical protein